MPGYAAVHRRILILDVDRWRRDQQLLRRALPVKRRVELLQSDRLRQLRRPRKHSALGFDFHSAAALGAGDRAVQTSQARGSSSRREPDVAESRLHIEPPRIARRVAYQVHPSIDPFTGRLHRLQTFAQVFLRQQPGQRQQGLSAQVTRPNLQLDQSGVIAAPAHVERGLRIAPSGGERTHPSPEKRPAIAGMADGQRAGNFIELDARLIGELNRHIRGVEIQVGAGHVGASSESRYFESPAAGTQPAQIVR